MEVFYFILFHITFDDFHLDWRENADENQYVRPVLIKTSKVKEIHG